MRLSHVASGLSWLRPATGYPACPVSANYSTIISRQHCMKKFHATVALGTALLGFSTTSCFKNETKSTVNADGTGKFTMVMELNLAPIMALMPGGAGGAGGANPLGDNRTMLVQMVRSMSPSVDAWTDAKVETTKAGATKITLSGLTKDFTATGDLKKALASAPAMAEKAASLPDLKMVNSTKDASGNWVISLPGVDDVMTLFSALQAEAAKEDSFTPGQMTTTEAEIATQIEGFKPMYAQYKPMAAMMLKDLSITSELEVGGEVLESKVFKKIGPNKVSWTFSGEQLIDMVDGIVNDPALPKKAAKLAAAFNEGPKSDKVAPALREFITPLFNDFYGGTAAPKVVIKPGAPSFDYAAEVAKAKSSQSPELKKILEEAAKPAEAPELPGAPGEADKPAPAAPKAAPPAPKVVPPAPKKKAA